MKVQLRKNLRMFAHDDTDFIIQGNQIQELPEKHLRSYSIKHYLFTGKLRVVEGDVLLKIKSALVYISPKGLYAKEYGKYFVKDLEFDSITWLDDDQVPKDVFAKLNGEEIVSVSPELVKVAEPVKVAEVVKEPAIEAEEEPEFAVADVNKDGKVDLKDVTEVVKSVFKKTKKKS